jgi:hypothetical protein
VVGIAQRPQLAAAVTTAFSDDSESLAEAETGSGRCNPPNGCVLEPPELAAGLSSDMGGIPDKLIWASA